MQWIATSLLLRIESRVGYQKCQIILKMDQIETYSGELAQMVCHHFKALKSEFESLLVGS